MRFLHKLKKLDDRGLAHFVLPLLVIVLVGAVGTYMLVGSHANSANRNRTPALSKGVLVVYGDDGYTGVQVVARNMDTKTHDCGKWNSGNIVQRNFPSAKVVNDNWVITPLKFSCTRTLGNEHYEVNYIATGNKLVATAYGVDIDSGICTSVYPDGSQTRTKYDKNDKSCGKVNTKKITKATPTLTVKPSVGGNKKTITGWVDLEAPAVTKVKCAGQVAITVTSADHPYNFTPHNLPLKFVNVKGRPAYCVAKLNEKVNAGATYNVKAEFAGNVFFNAAANSANLTVPAATAANNGTGGAEAP